ncbi:MAG: hypothetical protein QM714_10620 [Nocardioides sp.]|uniref:arsenate reductase/protein-tyrosine-phosphatase family protein n=1 Tax=Nocardioides sp. TaxID=35761 RepID=UPI0039E5F3C6
MTLQILVVCEGNICRSPMAERLLAATLVGHDVEVRSAGTRAVVGRGMSEHSATEVTARGGDAAGFAARQVTEQMVAEADLILVATRDLRTTTLELAPRAMKRAFTILEFAELARQAPDVLTGQELVAWAADHRPLAADVDQDVPDPVGRPPEVYRQVADLVEGAVSPIATALVEVN